MFTALTNEQIYKIDKIIDHALIEDIGKGDLTSNLLITDDYQIDFALHNREKITVCGISVVMRIFERYHGTKTINPHVIDGNELDASAELLSGRISARYLFSVERTLLNILQHMSGIATLTKKYVHAIEGTDAIILDTRKTLPNLRVLQKYAVKVGGGQNHRLGLDDGLLIKDNHIAAVGSISKAIALARAGISHLQKIEIECDNLDQVAEAVAYGADVILLDNMNAQQLGGAVQLVRDKALLEASGGITLTNIKEIALTGVNFISIGRLTHSANAVDIGLDILGPLRK